MPKKTAAPPQTLSPIQKKLAEVRKKDAALRIGSMRSLERVSTPLTTGNIELDKAIGVGGFPRGKVIELYGLSQSGKTTSALQAAATHIRRVRAGEDSGAVMYLDFEYSLDRDYCETLGIDTEDEETFILVEPPSLDHGCNLFRDFMMDGLLAMGIFDSVAAMTPESELEALTGTNTVGAKAKAMHQFMRQIKGPLYRTQTTAIFLNQVQEAINTNNRASYLPPVEVTPGGRALVFFSDIRIRYQALGEVKTDVVNPTTLKTEKVVTARTIQAKVMKNKVARPMRIATIRNEFGSGFSQHYSVFQVLLAYNVIKKAGGWYTMPEELGGEQFQGEDPVVALLKSDADLFAVALGIAHEKIASNEESNDFEVDENIDADTGEVKDAFTADQKAAFRSGSFGNDEAAV